MLRKDYVCIHADVNDFKRLEVGEDLDQQLDLNSLDTS